MKAKMAGMFIAGMAFGMLFLVIALWYSGTLNSATVLAGNKRPAAAPVLPSAPPPAAIPVAAPEPAPTSPPPTPPAAATTSTGSPPHLAMPIAGLSPAQLTDTFHEARDGRQHEALDIMSPRGTPVLAVAEGNVVKLFTSKPGGLTVYQFDDTDTWCYYYAHLDRYAAGLKEGTLLRKGDVLGYVGSTGNASPKAPHLHFAVNQLGPDKRWWEGTPIDPLPLFR